MRPQLPVIRYLVLLLALIFSTGTVAADSRSEARTHYQAGVKLYGGGDYKGAIKEFSAAQELAPADLNNYNLALCYDKLGDSEPAIQYYRAFLDKQPASDKKAEIEASIARLESAAKSAAAKKAAAQKEEDARKAAEAKKADEEARKAEEARRAEEARKPPETTAPPVAPVGGVGTTGTPGGSGTVSTGDAQLDRVARIDINQVRDQRVGGASSGMIDNRPAGGPATTQPGATPNDANNAAANIDVSAHAGAGAAAPNNPNAANTANTANANNPNNGTAPQPNQPDPSDKPKATPVYKKWWFWAVLAVSAYVVYSIATEDSSSNNTARMFPTMGNSNTAAAGAGGLTLMRW